MRFNIGKALKGLGKGALKVASFAPGPIGMTASGVGALTRGDNPLKAIGGDMMRNSKLSATLLPLAMTGGAAAGAMGGAGAAGAGGGGALGMLKGLGGKLLGNSDLLLGGLSMYQGQKAQNQANDLQKRALALAEQRYAETAPLREMGLKGLQNTQRRDLSATFRNNANPFA